MAKKKASKKKSKKKSKASARKSAPKRATRRTGRTEKRVLSDEERASMLRPRAEYDKIIEKILAELDARTIKVDGLSAAKLARLLRIAERARQRENALRTKQEQALRTISDARLVAEHTLWSAVLDVNATAKLAARKRPDVAGRFAFLTSALRGERPARGRETDDAGDEELGRGES